MPDIIRSRQGDTLDGLIWRERGLAIEDCGAVLAANPGLDAAGATLPTGTPVTIPAIAAPALPVRDVVQLWD
jgi:phage tail protein X